MRYEEPTPIELDKAEAAFSSGPGLLDRGNSIGDDDQTTQ